MAVDREQIRRDIADGRNAFNPEHIAALLAELEQAEREADQLDNRLDAANRRLAKVPALVEAVSLIANGGYGDASVKAKAALAAWENE